MINQKLDIESITEATATLVRLSGGRLHRSKLLHLLYLADRETLIQTGKTITGSIVMIDSNTPVLQDVRFLSEYRFTDPYWLYSFNCAGDYIVIQTKVGSDNLSEYEDEVLVDLFNKYKNFNHLQLKDIILQLPEFKGKKFENEYEMPYEEILGAAGVDEESIESFQSTNKSVNYILGKTTISNWKTKFDAYEMSLSKDNVIFCCDCDGKDVEITINEGGISISKNIHRNVLIKLLEFQGFTIRKKGYNE